MCTTAVAVTPIESNKLEPLLKIEEAARLLGRSHWSLRHDFKAGRIKCIRLGRNLMIETAEVRRLLKEGLEIA